MFNMFVTSLHVFIHTAVLHVSCSFSPGSLRMVFQEVFTRLWFFQNRQVDVLLLKPSHGF